MNLTWLFELSAAFDAKCLYCFRPIVFVIWAEYTESLILNFTGFCMIEHEILIRKVT